MAIGTPPQHAGLYWVKTDRCQWFNAVVEVVGDPPFLSLGKAINQYYYPSRIVVTDSDINEWGPEIIRPK